MQKITLFLIFVMSCLFSASQLKAQNLDKEIETIITPLIASISSQPVKNVAISDFTSLDGTSSELGKYLAEEFSFSLVNAKKSFIVIDRSRVAALLKENGLGSSGMMDPNTIAKLGKMKGIDAVIAGTLTSTGNSLRLIIKVWNLETQGLMSASKGDISKTPMIIELEGKGVSGGSSGGTITKVVPQAPAISKFTNDNFVFELLSCTQSGQTIEFKVRVTCYKDENLIVFAHDGRIIAISSNEFRITEVKLGDKIGSFDSEAQKSFVSNVPVNGIFTFGKITEKIEFIPKVEIICSINGGNPFPVEFRNIKVKQY